MSEARWRLKKGAVKFDASNKPNIQRIIMSDVYERIQTELVSSGKYKEIYTLLETELRNSGWYDNFMYLTEQTIEKTSDKDLQLNKLLSALQDRGIQSVPDEVKVKVIQKIAEFLNDVVE